MMSGPLYGVYGASGFGREVMALARRQLKSAGVPADRVVFVDDQPPAEALNGHPVITFDRFLALPATERFAVLAIADSSVRARLSVRCTAANVKPWSVAAADVITLDAVELGEGAVLCPFVMLSSNTRIGRHFHGNYYSYVAHDCVIGDFVTFAPAVKCSGNVVIEDHAYIGAGAIVRQGRSGKPLIIGRGAVVGMGAVVTKDVPAGATVVGNPARPLNKDQ